MIKRRTNLR